MSPAHGLGKSFALLRGQILHLLDKLRPEQEQVLFSHFVLKEKINPTTNSKKHKARLFCNGSTQIFDGFSSSPTPSLSTTPTTRTVLAFISDPHA
eukprot:m.27322 g.27322  ORF g.27322 m.27322 type:complete len:95 (-) comp8521_c0_seq1:399-683(-)